MNRQSHEIFVKRQWPIINNKLQIEDYKGYGSRFRSIPQFQTTDTPSLLTWSLFDILSSCKELWYVIDTKTTSLRSSGR